MVMKVLTKNSKSRFINIGKITAGLLALSLFVALSSCQSPMANTCDASKAASKIFLIRDNLSNWNSRTKPWVKKTGKWEIAGDAFLNPQDDTLLAAKRGRGVIVNRQGKTDNLLSKLELGDVQAHIEFMVPRGANSGVYFAGRYEIQVFDSWGVKKPKHSDCGGIYQRWDIKKNVGYEGRPPRVNASRPPGQWQSFDVIFRAPRFDKNGKKIANARFEKVTHNGIVVHENVELTGPTRSPEYYDEKPTGPIRIQGDHGPVAYRNIWVKPLD